MTQEKALQALHDENERLGLYKDAYAQRTWVGLTDMEKQMLINKHEGVAWEIANAVEQQIKEKNK